MVQVVSSNIYIKDLGSELTVMVFRLDAESRLAGMHACGEVVFLAVFVVLSIW